MENEFRIESDSDSELSESENNNQWMKWSQ